MADPTFFNGCGEVLAYSTIAIWLVTWTIKRVKGIKNTPVNSTKTQETTIPQGVLDFMIRTNNRELGNSFLPSTIPEDDLKYLDPCVTHGFLLKEFYKGIGDLYVITDKGKALK